MGWGKIFLACSICLTNCLQVILEISRKFAMLYTVLETTGFLFTLQSIYSIFTELYILKVLNLSNLCADHVKSVHIKIWPRSHAIIGNPPRGNLLICTNQWRIRYISWHILWHGVAQKWEDPFATPSLVLHFRPHVSDTKFRKYLDWTAPLLADLVFVNYCFPGLIVKLMHFLNFLWCWA